MGIKSMIKDDLLHWQQGLMIDSTALLPQIVSRFDNINNEA